MSTTTSKTKDGKAPYGFRAPAALVAKAREKATKQGLSLAALTHAIFVDYVTSDPAPVQVSGAALGQTVPLPEQTARDVRKVRDEIVEVERGDDRFNAYLLALKDAGWSLQSLADALDVTRQAISLRTKKASALDPKDVAGFSLPDVPARSTFTRSRSNLPADEVQLFSVRLDPPLHDEVRQRARGEGAAIAAILSAGFEKYIAGDLDVPGVEEP